MFLHLVYDKNYSVISPKECILFLFLTMNITEKQVDDKNFDYKYIFSKIESTLGEYLKNLILSMFIIFINSQIILSMNYLILMKKLKLNRGKNNFPKI